MTTIEALQRLTATDASMIRLAYRARAKLGLHGVSDLRKAVGRISRQLVYRTLTAEEIKELQK